MCRTHKVIISLPANVKDDIHQTLCGPAVFGPFNPALVKIYNVYNESLRLIGWFNPPSEKLSHRGDFRVGSKSHPNTAGQYSIYIFFPLKENFYAIRKRDESVVN